MKQELTTTIETRIPKLLLPLVDSVMLKYSEIYNHAKWCYFARKNRGETINKPSFCREFKIPSRLFNAIKGDVDGMIQSQLSNIQRYIVEAHQKIADAEAYIGEQQSKITVLNAPSRQSKTNTIALDKAYRAIRGKRRLIQRKQSAIEKWLSQLESGRVSVCAGSKKMFSKQHSLFESGYRSHKQWLKDYRLARNDEFYIKGSKDESTGNTLCRLTKDGDQYALTLSLPESMQEQGFAKNLVLNNLTFNHKSSILDDAIISNQRRVELGSKGNLSSQFILDNHAKNIEEMKIRGNQIVSNMMKRGDDEQKIAKAVKSYEKRLIAFSKQTKSNLLCDFGQAISYRFKHDSKGWRVIVTITRTIDQPYITDIKNGCIGIDLNEHHLAVTEVDSNGGKVGTEDLFFHKNKSHDISSRQTRTALEEAIKVVIAKAIATRKPVAIEELDFKVSKANLIKGFNQTFNRTVSSMITARFLVVLKARCIENGVELKIVKAAYTSMIGRMKFANQFKFNIHAAAAMAIARRGMGKIDLNFPSQVTIVVRNRQMTFPVPADTRKYDAFGYYKQVKTAYDKWLKFTLELLRGNTKVLTQGGYDEDVFI